MLAKLRVMSRPVAVKFIKSDANMGVLSSWLSNCALCRTSVLHTLQSMPLPLLFESSKWGEILRVVVAIQMQDRQSPESQLAATQFLDSCRVSGYVTARQLQDMQVVHEERRARMAAAKAARQVAEQSDESDKKKVKKKKKKKKSEEMDNKSRKRKKSSSESRPGPSQPSSVASTGSVVSMDTFLYSEFGVLTPQMSRHFDAFRVETTIAAKAKAKQKR